MVAEEDEVAVGPGGVVVDVGGYEDCCGEEFGVGFVGLGY